MVLCPLVAALFASHGDILYLVSRILMYAFEHENSRAMSRIEQRFSRYFCLIISLGMGKDVMQTLDVIENCGMNTDFAQRGLREALRCYVHWLG